MRIQLLLIAMLCSISVTLIPAASEAADIHVSIEGVEITCPTGSCATEFILSQSDGQPKAYPTYGFTIEGVVVDGVRRVAKVVSTDAAGTDKLELKDAWIVSTQASLTKTIAFWRTFTDPPNAPPTVTFRREAVGALERGTEAAVGDWVVVKGYVLGNEIDVGQAKQVICPTPMQECAGFLLSKFEDWYTLSGARGLTGWFKFNLANSSDKLSLTSFSVFGAPAGVAGDKKDKSIIEGIPKDPGFRSMKECYDRNHGQRCLLPGPDKVPGKGDAK